MIVNGRPPSDGRIHIDLKGEKGNAFVLLGIAHKLATDLDKDWKLIH